MAAAAGQNNAAANMNQKRISDDPSVPISLSG
jgi:hypothetical protein